MNLLGKLLIAAGMAVSVQGAAAAAYPERPLRLIVPFSAGGTTDFAARQIGKELGDALGQSIIVENRGGAGGIIAVKELLNAPPDGYTLFMGTVGTQTVNTLLFKKLPYDPDKNMLPIGLATNSPSVLTVRKSLPVKTLDEFVKYAKAHPGVLNYAAAGTMHLGIETLKAYYGLDIVKVPYKGSGESAAAVAGGQVDVLMDVGPIVSPQINGGKITPLAVLADKRLNAIPHVPTTVELGVPDLKAGNWTALYVAAGTPPEVVQTLNKTLQKILGSAALQARLADYGIQLYKGSTDEYETFMAADKVKVKKLVEASGLEPQ